MNFIKKIQPRTSTNTLLTEVWHWKHFIIWFFVSSREKTSWVDQIRRWPLPKVKYDVILLYPQANNKFSHETSFICQSYRFISLIVRKHRKRDDLSTKVTYSTFVLSLLLESCMREWMHWQWIHANQFWFTLQNNNNTS